MLADKHIGKQPRRFSSSICSVSPSISISLTSSCISLGENSLRLEMHLLRSVVNVVNRILAYMRLVLLEDATRWRTLAL